MGQPKESLPFGDETLLERVVRLVGTVVRTVVVVGAPAPEQPFPAFPVDVKTVRDPVFGRGPLQGIVTGLEALPDSIELAYVTAVDTPFLNPRWIDHLAERISNDDDIIAPFVGGRYHPLSAIYRRDRVLPAARSMLGQEQLRVTGLLEYLRTRGIPEAEMEKIDPGFQSLRNLNTPEDYHAALVDAGLAGPHRATGPTS